MNRTVELERKSAQLTSDIQDVLHAAAINFKALSVEATLQPCNVLKKQFDYLEQLLLCLQKLFDQRPQLFMGYLITKQIQDEEQRVRRQRLSDYQQKIYDQRRIIADKEGFFQSLLRPKRKRLAGQSAEEFQELKTKQRENQEHRKTEQLLNDVADLQALRKLIQEKEIWKKKKQLELTKSSSVSQVNITSLCGEVGQFATQKIISLDDRTTKESISTHLRSSSLQNSIALQPHSIGKKQRAQDISKLAPILQEIQYFRTENSQLQKIYDQECLALKFKKGQCGKLKSDYQKANKQLKLARQKTRIMRKQEEWRYQRVSAPINTKRSNSGSK